jgi:TonB family protein
MPKKWKFSLARSFFLHGILLLVIALLVYHPHEEPNAIPPITIENINIGKAVKKAIHTVVHSIGIPHQEPGVTDDDGLSQSAERGAKNEGAADIPAQEVGINSSAEMQMYLSGIIARINAKKKYPKSAQFNEQEGLVQIRMEIGQDGLVIHAEVEKPCAFPTLNDAALEAVRSVEKLPPLPPSNSAKSIVLHAPIRFKIEH